MIKHFATIRGPLPNNFPRSFPHIGYKEITQDLFTLSYEGRIEVLESVVSTIIAMSFEYELVGFKSVPYEQ